MRLWDNGITLIAENTVNSVRTVSDTKRSFYSTHTRPINSIYRRVVEELMVEMHLLSVNADFYYDAIYALGVVSTFDRFMQGYRPDGDKPSIFNALCQAIGDDPQKFQNHASQLRADVSGLSLSDFEAQVSQSTSLTPGNELQHALKAVGSNEKFKYSRLFAIGLYNLLEAIDPETVKDEKRRNDALKNIADGLKLSFDKIQKDLELYRSNLEKIAQAQIVMADMLKAERKRKEDREKARAAANPPEA